MLSFLRFDFQVETIVIMIFHDLDLLSFFEVTSEIFYSSTLLRCYVGTRELIRHPTDKIVFDLFKVIKVTLGPPLFEFIFFDDNSLVNFTFLLLSSPFLSEQLGTLFFNNVFLSDF